MRILAILAPLLALLCVPLARAAAMPASTPARVAAAPATEIATRAVSAPEMASFAASVPQLALDAGAGTPVFAAERAAGARAWTVSATVDGVAARGAGQLCHVRRMRFVYQPQAAAARWRLDTSTELAWLGAAGQGTCMAPAQPIVLLQALPDTDVLGAWTQLAPLLQRARLLMSGNSSCAHLRSVNFRLAGMGVSTPPQGAEQMQVLRFDSDRNSTAQVWIRRRGLELEAWNVACALN